MKTDMKKTYMSKKALKIAETIFVVRLCHHAFTTAKIKVKVSQNQAFEGHLGRNEREMNHKTFKIFTAFSFDSQRLFTPIVGRFFRRCLIYETTKFLQWYVK